MAVLFFDIGATLADARVEPDGSLTLLPLPRVLAVLAGLGGMRQGIISNPGPGEAAMARAAAALRASFPGHFTDESLVHWGSKDSRELFDRAVASAAVAPDDCVFVGEHPDERAFAREAGMRTAAHPMFALAAVENRPVFSARIGLPDGTGLPELAAVAERTEVVPLDLVSDRVALALVSELGTGVLTQAGYTVESRGP